MEGVYRYLFVPIIATTGSDGSITYTSSYDENKNTASIIHMSIIYSLTVNIMFLQFYFNHVVFSITKLIGLNQLQPFGVNMNTSTMQELRQTSYDH